MPYDTLKDFAPITLVASSSALLVLHPSIPANTVPQLIALAKAKTSRLNYASSGNGSSGHLAGELFKTMTGVNMTHIPYRGNGVAFTDLIAGQVQMMFAITSIGLPQAQIGKADAVHLAASLKSGAFFVALLITGASFSMPHALVAYGRIH